MRDRPEARTERPHASSRDALADRIRGVLLRPEDVRSGSVDVRVEHDDVVTLRGHVERPEEAGRLVAAASGIPGVRGVDSSLRVERDGPGPQPRQARWVTERANRAAERELAATRGRA